MTRRGLVTLLALALIVTACGESAAVDNGRSTAASQKAAPVIEQAKRFMNLFRGHQFSRQWNLLAGAARAQWPRRRARTNMLTAKFAGMRVSYRLGRPVPGRTWISEENGSTARQVWEVPVSVDLKGGAHQLPDTLSLFQGLHLYLTSPTAKAPALIVGEGPASLDAPILLPLHQPRFQVSVPSLMYHDINAPPPRALFATQYAYQLQYNLTVSVTDFAGQIDWLANHGYHAISLARLSDALYYQLSLPSRPVVITFDDGFLGQFTQAAPILRRHGFTATFFICTGLMGWLARTQQYLSWDQAQTLSQQGFWIEDHTVNDDTSLYGLNQAGLESLIVSTQSVIASHLHQPVQFFAYSAEWPYPTSAQSGPLVDGIMSVLRSAGYQLALTDPVVPSTNVSSALPYQVPRVRVSPDEAIQSFAENL
jgi:peptidoglycan/xylan/chitin deacetylase (PgdA/CDA1 family)